MACAPTSTTLYLAPDFEVRDGLATTYVKAGQTNIARVEEPAFATTFFPDLAPLGAGTFARPVPDGVITAADAWVVQAAKAGLVDLPPPEAAKAKSADVDKMLASAARRILGADAPQTTYVSHDHLGSPSLVTGVTGAVVARRWHGPYGEVRGATGASNETRGFTGKERDGATGLADHGAKYLDTRLGRWTATDPLAVRELGGAELDVYGYVDGRVTSHHDPDGQVGHIVFGVALGGFVGGAVEGARQYYAGHFDGRALGVAVVGGAATGAMAGATCGASLATQATVMGATNAYVGTMSRVAGGQQVSAGTLATDAAIGALGPAVAKIAAPVISRAVGRAQQGRFASITGISKGARPAPETYMSARELRAHAALFDGGAARISPTAPTGTLGHAETWVMPSTVADDLIHRSGGDVSKLERLLGLDAGYLGSSPIRVDIPLPANVRVPTGNEWGANNFWQAGGKTSGGLTEAIIDPVAPGSYTSKPVY